LEVEIDITVARPGRTATLERVAGRSAAAAGRSLPLKVSSAPIAAATSSDAANRFQPTRSSLSVLVSDGARLSQAEQREAIAAPRSVAKSIKSLNKARQNNTLYIKLLGANAALSSTASCCQFRATVLGVLGSRSQRRTFNPLHNAVQRMNYDRHAVSGSRTVTISISQYSETSFSQRPWLPVRPRRLLRQQSPSFQAATQANFLKGDVENHHRQRQPAALGPATEQIYEPRRRSSGRWQRS
jgi:hypothetical protein